MIKLSKLRYPVPIVVSLISLILIISLVDSSSFLNIQHPPKQEYPWLYYVNNIYENSILTNSILKIIYEKTSWMIVFMSLCFYIFYFYKTKKFFFSEIIYLTSLFVLKLVFHFFFKQWKFIIEILELPFVLVLYSYFFHYLFCFYTNQKFQVDAAKEFFLNSYGKIFFFVFILNLGIESLPFDELSIYSSKYGVSTAWKIISYRNLLFDILFFALVWSYLVYISFFKKISFISSFLSLNEILKSIKWKIFLYGFIYYSCIGLVTLLDFYFNIQNWKLILLVPIYFVLLEKMYSFFIPFLQSLGKVHAEGRKTQRARK